MKSPNQNYESSRDYETLIRCLVEQEVSGIDGVQLLEVLQDVKMQGLSGYTHQIDVAYRFRIWKLDILVIVECKHYKKRVGVDDLLEFRSRIEDLRAHKGLLVTSSGFQSGAEEFARANRIGLMIVRGTTHSRVVRVRDVCYRGEAPPDVACRLQAEQIGNAYANVESFISINYSKHVVLLAREGVTLEIEPGELQQSLDSSLRECDFADRMRDDLLFQGARFPHLRGDKVIKYILIEEVLAGSTDTVIGFDKHPLLPPPHRFPPRFR
jgi:hypothetical protein